jgi:hypothetical protein
MVAEIASELSLDQHGALAALVGKWLPEVFEKNFKAKAGRGRNKDGTPNGPYIRFAHAALDELQIKRPNGQRDSDETIVRAMTELKSGRARRKSALGNSK